VGSLYGLAEEVVASVDSGGDQLKKASERQALMPRVFNAIVLTLAALLLLLHAVHS